EMRRFEGGISRLFHGVFSPDGKHLAVGGFDRDRQGAVEVWSLASGERVGPTRRYNRPVKSLAYASEEVLLLGEEGISVLWTDAATGKVLSPAGPVRRGGDRPRLAFSADGRFAYADEEWIVRVSESGAGEHLTFRGHVGDVYSIAFRPDGERLASAGL